MSLNIYPGTYNHQRENDKSEKKSGQVPLLALLVIFGITSLFSVLAFFLAILALQK